MAVITLFAPATRIGYLLYPINFFVWAHLFSDRAQAPSSTECTSQAADEPRPIVADRQIPSQAAAVGRTRARISPVQPAVGPTAQSGSGCWNSRR